MVFCNDSSLFSDRIDHTCMLESKWLFNKVAIHAKVVVPPTNSKSSLCENNPRTFVMTNLGGLLGMRHTNHACPISNSSSSELPYMLSMQ